MFIKKFSNLYKNFLKIILYFYKFFFAFSHKGLRKPNLSLHPKGEFISDIIRKTGFHYEISLLIYCLKKFDCSKFIDVGANIGNHSNFFELFKATGYCFEPDINNFNLLKKNVKNFQLFNCALGAKNSQENLVSFNTSRGNSYLMSNFNNVIKNWGGGLSTQKLDNFSIKKVKVRTLDSFNISKPTLIKIDAEGSELDILIGMSALLKKYSPTLWIEIHEDETLKKNKFPYTRKKIFNYLKRKSYIKFSFFNDTNFFFNK